MDGMLRSISNPLLYEPQNVHIVKFNEDHVINIEYYGINVTTQLDQGPASNWPESIVLHAISYCRRQNIFPYFNAVLFETGFADIKQP